MWSGDQNLMSLLHFYEKQYRNLNVIKVSPEKKKLFEGCAWFRLDNLGLPLGMTLIFYTSVAKGLKLKARKFWGLIPTSVEVTGEKLSGGFFAPLHPASIKGLNYLQYLAPKIWNLVSQDTRSANTPSRVFRKIKL